MRFNSIIAGVVVLLKFFYFYILTLSFYLCLLQGIYAENVKLISNLTELAKIGNDPQYPLDGIYQLTNDIDAGITIQWDEGRGFQPIGSSVNPFNGVFDGAGKKIRRLFICRPSQSYVGLFGYVGSSGQIMNVGIEEAYIMGDQYVGILVGCNLGSITNSYAQGYVCGDFIVGVLVGYNGGGISQSFAQGDVKGAYTVGGLIGMNVSTGYIAECYSSTRVMGAMWIGGLLARNQGSVDRCYWDTEASGQTTSAGGEGRTTNQMKFRSTYVDWNFNMVWDIEEGNNYPFLRSLRAPTPPLPVGVKELSGIEEITKIGRDWEYPWNGTYKLRGDINARDTMEWNEGAGFAPIVFAGNFDGNGYVIRNLIIHRDDEDYIGLFAINFGEITNLGLESTDVTGGFYVGTLVGKNYGNIRQCYSTGTVTGDGTVGGLVGYHRYGALTNSYSHCVVVGTTEVGGLIGNNWYGTIQNCLSTGAVSGSEFIGGLIGWDELGNVSNSYWDTITSGQNTSPQGIGKTTSQLYQRITYSNWDFTEIWNIYEGQTYPFLRWQGGPPGTVNVPNLIGLTELEARQKIYHAGLLLGRVTYTCRDTIPANQIIQQTPNPPTRVFTNTSVDIVVVSGPCAEGETEGTFEGNYDGEREGSFEGGYGYPPHSADTNGDWKISLSELLRVIQLFNLGGYRPCPELSTEDGYCPRQG